MESELPAETATPQFTDDQLLQFLMQELDFRHCTKTLKVLQEETECIYNPVQQFGDMTRLTALLNLGAMVSREIREASLDRTDQAVSKLREQLANVGLLPKAAVEVHSEGDIWDELPDAGTNIRYQEGLDVAALSSPEEQQLVDLGYYSPIPPSAIVAGTLNKLVGRLAQSDVDSFEEAQYQTVILRSYHLWCSPATLLDKLMQRYDVPWPTGVDGLLEPDVFERTIQRPIQLRVVNFISNWVTYYFSDFNDALLERLSAWAETVVGQDSIPLTNKLRGAIARRVAKPLKRVLTVAGDHPSPQLPPGIPASKLTLADVPAVELARQLALMVHEKYAAIETTELHKCAWLESDARTLAPNVVAMQALFNHIASVVSTAVVTPERAIARARAYQYWAAVATELRALHSLDGLNAVLAGLSNAAVYRLKQTLLQVPKRVLDSVKELQDLTNPNGSYKNLRAEIKSVGDPVTPYLGMYLSDLAFTEEANTDLDDGLLNLTKGRLVSNIIGELASHQGFGFALLGVEAVQELIERAPVLTEEELDAASAEREGR
ncbi:RasGEF domain [Carpediemonas membranifera]|uniref:RasGEF domain n=1 Tax=Carpediemonas membranifera TaxID=201153 RepID=A0A8J6B0W8_9EUKA|nr:RasGEF domain [Carpediemonas membranifera]|eukprot:KAG9396045.1 RasGEF domain [Carpediemonas membranifera]